MEDIKYNIYKWGFLGNILRIPIDFKPTKFKYDIKNKNNKK